MMGTSKQHSYCRYLLLSFLVVGILQVPTATAFVAPSKLVTTLSTSLWSTPPGPSSGGSIGTGGGDAGDLDDDETLSKLIGKRSQIKRNKRTEPDPLLELEAPLPKDVPLPSDLDLESMPEFKTARPNRKSKKEQEAEAAMEAAASKGEGDDAGSSLAFDFKAEYDDENDFHIPNRLGFSTVGWGDVDRGFVAEGKVTKRMAKAGKYVSKDCKEVYNKLLEGGIYLVETSSVYGKASRKQSLSAQDILAASVIATNNNNIDGGITPLVIESLPSSWLPPRPSAMRKTAEASCERLKIDTVDIVQASKRIPLLAPILANGLMQIMEGGSCNYVGVAGILQRSSLRRFADAVESKGGTLTSNAFEFSLTNLKNEAMMDHCKDMGVIPLILNPLDGGLASGVYTASNPSGGGVGGAKFKFETLEKLQPLHSVMETVVERVRTRVTREQRDMKDRFRSKYGPPPNINTDITTTQIAINYVVAKGGVPLPEINTPSQADELLGCVGWSLTEDEVDMLDGAATLVTL